jgi:hypothetical protein
VDVILNVVMERNEGHSLSVGKGLKENNRTGQVENGSLPLV